MSQLDELRVDETGTIDVRVIPEDDVSTEACFLVSYPAAERNYGPVRRHLAGLANSIDCSDIVSIVHDGETDYTIRSRDGSFKEINAASHPAATEIIQQLAAYAERSARARQVAKKASAEFRGSGHRARQ